MSVPRGFLELVNPEAFPGITVPAFLRGVLLDRAVFDKMSLYQRSHMCWFPRVVVYGGPIVSIQQAREWDTAMFFWASSVNRVWECGEDVAIVPKQWMAWPSDTAFRWTWVNETAEPKRVARVFKGGAYRLEWSG